MPLASPQTRESKKQLARIVNVHLGLQVFWLLALSFSYRFLFLSFSNAQIAQAICLCALVFSFLTARFYRHHVGKLEQHNLLLEADKEKVKREYATAFLSSYVLWLICYLVL